MEALPTADQARLLPNAFQQTMFPGQSISLSTSPCQCVENHQPAYPVTIYFQITNSEASHRTPAHALLPAFLPWQEPAIPQAYWTTPPATVLESLASEHVWGDRCAGSGCGLSKPWQGEQGRKNGTVGKDGLLQRTLGMTWNAFQAMSRWKLVGDRGI